MKKIILISLSITLVAASQAQFKVGLLAGGNKINQRLDITEGSFFAGDNTRSFHTGVKADILLGGNFFLQPHLLYSRKGATHLSSMDAKDKRVTLNYVEAPVNLVYKIGLPFGKAFLGTGVSFSYAIAGKEKQDGQVAKLFRENSAWNRKDLGLNFTAGIEFSNGLFASLNSQKGLLDVYRGHGMSVKNKSTSFSVGYLIDLNN